MSAERPKVDPCERCERPRVWHGFLSTNLEGQPPELEMHMYRCFCYWPPVQVLERRNGGEWTWRKLAAGHVQ